MDKNFLANIKLLRNYTKISILECKNALEHSGGDISKAIYKLRSDGILKIIRNSLHKTSEGLVVVVINDNKSSGVILELNCETDFTANSVEFIEYANDSAHYALLNKLSSVDVSIFFDFNRGDILYSRLKELVSKCGENIFISRVRYFETNTGFIYGYAHGKLNYGKFGSLLIAKGVDYSYAYDVSIHIAALDPKYLTISSISSDDFIRERTLFFNEVMKNFKNKKLTVLNNIVDGKMNKYYEQVVLYEQVFVKSDNNKLKVKDVIKDKFDVIEYIRFGIEKSV